MRLLALLFALLAAVFTPAWAQSFPPSPKQLVAVNPVTNKVYVANEAANTVTVLDEATNTTKTIPVGNRPQFIVVNPLTNRVFVLGLIVSAVGWNDSVAMVYQVLLLALRNETSSVATLVMRTM